MLNTTRKPVASDGSSSGSNRNRKRRKAAEFPYPGNSKNSLIYAYLGEVAARHGKRKLGLLIRRSQVRILPGALEKCRFCRKN